MVFKPGESGNIAGRPKGALGKVKTSQLEKLLEALDKIGKEQKEEFMHLVARLAYHDVTMTKEVLKKMVADRSYLTESKEGDGSVVKVVFETIETHWSAREAMVDNNKEGLLNILEQLESGEINAIDALNKIGDELLKKKVKEDSSEDKNERKKQ